MTERLKQIVAQLSPSSTSISNMADVTMTKEEVRFCFFPRRRGTRNCRNNDTIQEWV